MKKILTLLILSTTTLAFADYRNGGCSSCQNNQGQKRPQAQAQPQAQGAQDQNQAPVSQSQQDDQTLRRSLQDLIRSSDKYSNVQLTVNNGYVTLSGYVASQDDKNALEQLVKGTKGVLGISNQLEIQTDQNQQ